MSTSASEVLNDAAERPIERFQNYLVQVREIDDPNQQWLALDPAVLHTYGLQYGYERAMNIGTPDTTQAMMREGLIDFAADSRSSNSLIVRLRALELTVQGSELHQRTINYDVANAAQFRDSSSTDYSAHIGASYRYVSKELIIGDDLDEDLVFPPESLDEIDRKGAYPDYNPYLSLQLLDNLRIDPRHHNQFPQSVRLKPLDDDIQQALASHNNLPDSLRLNYANWSDVAKCNRLLAYGENYQDVFLKLIESQDAAAEQYFAVLSELPGKAEKAALAFPERYQKGAEEGMNRLLADALYAGLQAILQRHSLLAIEVPFKDGARPLKLPVWNGFVQDQLRLLGLVFDEMGKTRSVVMANGIRSEHPRSIKVNGDTDFGLYRLVRPNDQLQDTTVYIRPYGDRKYDRQLEYGRPTEGVEASISFVVDFKRHGLQSVGRHTGTSLDSRISVRLDREGVEPSKRGDAHVRDPTQRKGTLSLDVSSVLGNENSAGTMLGRFLAWGNYLRTQSMGTKTQLNHMTEYFTEEDGDADIFANEAIKLALEFEKTRLSQHEVAELFGGKLALVGAQETA